MARQPAVGQGLLINEASRSHSDTPQSLSCIFSMARQSPVGLGLLTVEVSRSDTPHLGGLLWTSDRPLAETSPLQHTTLIRDIHASVGLEPTIRASKRPQTHILDRACLRSASSIYCSFTLLVKIFLCSYLQNVFINQRKVLHKKGRYRTRSKINFVPSTRNYIIFTQLRFLSSVTRIGKRFTVNTVTTTLAAVP
jgi:hypothetical protein